MTKIVIIAAFTAMFAFSSAALSQHHGHGTPAPSGHSGHVMPGMKPQMAAPLSDASRAFADANSRMHKGMNAAFSGNADVDFASAMIPHHQGAIDVSEIVLRYGKDTEVKKMASAIIVAQKTEIAQMMTWLGRNAASPASTDATAITKAFTDVNMKMHTDMTMSFTSSPDADFIKGMIPHHEGAVAMAKVLLQFGKDPELRKLAEDVVRTQNEEISMMRGWLKKAGG